MKLLTWNVGLAGDFFRKVMCVFEPKLVSINNICKRIIQTNSGGNARVSELSGDGNTIALGNPDSGTGGFVEVWRYSNPGSTTGTWSQIGQTISGVASSNCGDGFVGVYNIIKFVKSYI